ncbi:MAG: GIY-YIG nuclease family protein [Clostridia bacterium]|nr:GIY-YIG nuclease family protein [Clostridia bacterium]
MYFVYLLRCVDSSIYCGYTTDVAHRIKAHKGEIPGGAKYTRSHPPVRVETVWSCFDKSAALSLERALKSLERCEKEALIKDASLSALPEGKIDPSDYFACPEYVGDI